MFSQESLFMIEAAEKSIIFWLSREDLISLATKSRKLKHALDRIACVYKFQGRKYDFYEKFEQSLTPKIIPHTFKKQKFPNEEAFSWMTSMKETTAHSGYNELYKKKTTTFDRIISF